VSIFIQVHSTLIDVPRFIAQFVNFDAKPASLWNILPEDYPAFEFCSYIAHCQILSGVVEFSLNLIHCVKGGL
jgi:hypothetical protein